MNTIIFIKRLVLIAITCVGAWTLSGCHTVAGVGQDVRHVGNRIQQGAHAMHP